jgi:hypothetical protein
VPSNAELSSSLRADDAQPCVPSNAELSSSLRADVCVPLSA